MSRYTLCRLPIWRKLPLDFRLSLDPGVKQLRARSTREKGHFRFPSAAPPAQCSRRSPEGSEPRAPHPGSPAAVMPWPGGVECGGCLRLATRCPRTSTPCLQISPCVYGRLFAERSAQVEQPGSPCSTALRFCCGSRQRPDLSLCSCDEKRRPGPSELQSPAGNAQGRASTSGPRIPNFSAAPRGSFQKLLNTLSLYFFPLLPGNHKKYTDYKRSFNSEQAQG